MPFPCSDIRFDEKAAYTFSQSAPGSSPGSINTLDTNNVLLTKAEAKNFTLMCTSGTGHLCDEDPRSNLVAFYLYDSGDELPSGSCGAQFSNVASLVTTNQID